MSLTLKTKAEYDKTNNIYKFNSFGNNTELKIGLGTYIITNISQEFPISFESNDKIKFCGMSYNLFMNDYRKKGDNFNLEDIQNDENRQFNKPYTKIINNLKHEFYYGNVALKVNGDFNKINKYYILNQGKIQEISHTISFDEDNNNGSKQNNYLEFSQVIPNIDTFFFHVGNKQNGKFFNNENGPIYSNVNSYVDLENLSCMYIESNNVPNYKILNTNNSENTTFTINQQNYGIIDENNRILSNPFKIPIHPIFVEDKEIPEKIFETEGLDGNAIPLQIYKESFWN